MRARAAGTLRRAWARNSQRPVLFFLLVGLVLLAGSVALMIARGDHRTGREDIEKARATERASEAAQAINASLIETELTAKGIVRGLDSGCITANAAQSALRRTVQEHPSLWGAGIVYDPRRPQAPANGNNYYTRPGGVITQGQISYNFTDVRDSRSHWWRHAFETGEGWIPPYLGGTSNRMVALYAAPFYGPDAPDGDEPAGVVLVSLQLDTLNRSVGWSELGADGYGLVVSRSGSYSSHPSGGRDGGFIAHPVKSYWRGSAVPTFPDVLRRTGNTHAMALLDPPGDEEPRVLDYKDEVTGEDAWLFYESIPTADWVLGYVVVKSTVLAGDETDFHYQIWIGLLVIGGVSSFAAAAAARFLRHELRLWAVAGLMTLAPAVGIGLIWNLALSKETQPNLETDGVSLRRAVDSYDEYVTSVSIDLESETVLAGVFLEAMEENENGTDWDISGTVWQRYSNGVPAGEEPGFVFPDAVAPPVFEESHDVQDGSSRTIGWRFAATMRPRFDRQHYPFDEVLLTVRMTHRQIDRPIVLLPDVGEYDLIMPSSQPGLSPNVELSGFDIQESYFGYTASELNSTFGIPNFARQIGAPEMTFTVRLTRQFLDPFISQMLPLIVVAGLLFAVHLMSTRPGEWTVEATPNEVPRGVRQRAWRALPRAGGDVREDPDRSAHSVHYTQATLTAVLGLMFVSILSHNSLRSSLVASEIIYLEYAYFIVYGALLLVALNSLLFSAGLGGIIVQWRRNLIPELAYWPMVTTAMFVATFGVFY